MIAIRAAEPTILSGSAADSAITGGRAAGHSAVAHRGARLLPPALLPPPAQEQDQRAQQRQEYDDLPER
jgi:hypothetical protein